jgi:hypothetical protein
MTDTTSQKSGPTKASVLARHRNPTSSGFVTSPTAKPRLIGIPIPSYPKTNYGDILKSGIEIDRRNNETKNSVVPERLYPQSSYDLHNDAPNHTRNSDIQMQTAVQSRDGMNEPIQTSDNEFEGKEHLRPECENVLSNRTDGWAADRVPFSRSNKGPDGRLKTVGLGTTSSLFSFADQEDKNT